MAHAYRQQGRAVGEGDSIWYATAGLKVEYRRPVPMAAELQLRAEVLGFDARNTRLSCVLMADGLVCSDAEVEAVRVPESWMELAK